MISLWTNYNNSYCPCTNWCYYNFIIFYITSCYITIWCRTWYNTITFILIFNISFFWIFNFYWDYFLCSPGTTAKSFDASRQLFASECVDEDGNSIQVVITEDCWNSLTEEQQNILVEAGKIAGAYNKEMSAQKEAEVLETLKAEGCNVVEVTDIAPWQEATKSVIDANIKGLEEYYQQIVDMAP